MAIDSTSTDLANLRAMGRKLATLEIGVPRLAQPSPRQEPRSPPDRSTEPCSC
jgi:hypothetical protein